MKGTLFDLPVTIGNVTLRNPFVVGSGPTVKNLPQLELIEKCGWGAASTKQTYNPRPYISYDPRYRWLKKEKLHIFTAEHRLDMETGLRLVEDARKTCKELVIIANYSDAGDNLDSWEEGARRFEAAGTQILELNFCCPNMSFSVDVSDQKAHVISSGASMGQDPEIVAAVVRRLRTALSIPIIAKITPEGGRIAQVAKAAIDAGADAVSGVANRLGIAPIDIRKYKKPIYNLQGENTMGCMSGPWIRPLAMRDVFEMRKLLGPGSPHQRHGRHRLHAGRGADDDVRGRHHRRLHRDYAPGVRVPGEMDEGPQGLHGRDGLRGGSRHAGSLAARAEVRRRADAVGRLRPGG